MKNWIKTDDGTWVNLDYLTATAVYKDDGINQFMIRAWTNRDDRFDLFNKCFSTREEAQEYLDKIMKECRFEKEKRV